MKCKAGDLAFIIKSKYPQNIGRIVCVLEFENDVEGGGVGWLVEAQSAMQCRIIGKNITYFEKTAFCRDDCLMPIGKPSAEAVDEFIFRLAVPKFELSSILGATCE